MISYRFVPISSQKGVLFFETPGIALKKTHTVSVIKFIFAGCYCSKHKHIKGKLQVYVACSQNN